MRTRILPAILLCIVAGLASAATPVDLTQIPGKTRWLVHLDADGFLGSRLGNWLRGQVDAHEKKAQLDALVSLARFDPFKDLRSLTVGGTTPDPENAVLYVRGTFDAAHLVTMLKAIEGYEATVHGATVIHSWPDKGSRSYGCFARKDLILISRNLDALGVCLDTIAGTKPNLADVPGIGEVMQRPAYLVGLATGVADLAKRDPKAAALENVEDVFLQLGEDGDKVVVTASVQAASEEAAGLLDQVVLGIRAAAILNAGGMPEIVNQLVDGLVTERDGQTISASLSLPTVKVIGILEDELRKKLGQ